MTVAKRLVRVYGANYLLIPKKYLQQRTDSKLLTAKQCKYFLFLFLTKFFIFFLFSKVEKTNSIESWSPNDYARAAGRSNTGKLPSAMDFMSRLDSDVKAIDFNSSSSCNNSSENLVKIHKRERSPTSSQLLSSSSSSSNTSSSSQGELSKKKKYKLVENTLSLTTQVSASTTAKLNSFSFAKKQQVSANTDENKKAPEDRLEFLRVVSCKNFSTINIVLTGFLFD